VSKITLSVYRDLSNRPAGEADDGSMAWAAHACMRVKGIRSDASGTIERSPMSIGSGKKQLTVFVHGFGSSKRCWDALLDLLHKDPKVTSLFDLDASFEYHTNAVNWSFLTRIPRLAECAKALQGFLKPRFKEYPHVTLVGHSQGGLVIQTYLANRVQELAYDELARIRQGILIATPHLGSTTLSFLRKLFFTFFANPQERALRRLDPVMADVLHVVAERIEGILPGDPKGWPIPIHCFSGLSDAVVPEASARGPFAQCTSVDGDHFSVLRPLDQSDERYKRFVEALLEPVGHKHVWELDLFEQRICVEPLPEAQRQVLARHGARERPVHTDNVAHVTRSVKFGSGNRCTDLFTLRYATRDQGYVTFNCSHKNEASPQEVGVYDDHGYEAVFKFRPNQTDTFKLHVDVYKGFDKGHRDVHFHLGKHQSFFKNLRYVLDLRAYVNAHYDVVLPPRLYFHSQDNGHSALCKQRVLDEPLASEPGSEPGVWQWELQDLQGGVVDMVWDVKEPAAPGT
jgi:pimeloyl-ACP methyl ester carboxylesterase